MSAEMLSASIEPLYSFHFSVSQISAWSSRPTTVTSFFQTCKFAQITRNKDTSLRVELCIEGVGAVIALDAARLFAVAETADACFERSPLCVGVDKKTAVEALCDREVLAELVAQLGRHGKAPFCVDGMPVFALHPVSPHTRLSCRLDGMRDTLPHISPLLLTL